MSGVGDDSPLSQIFQKSPRDPDTHTTTPNIEYRLGDIGALECGGCGRIIRRNDSEDVEFHASGRCANP